MKNLHLIPTDKPSRLGYLTKKGKEVYKDLRLFEKPMPIILESENQNIYITSDEKIETGNYYLCKLSMRIKKCIGDEYFNNIDEKKIILTTDQHLIKDGVQDINDEFLEWFIENSSCEYVETKISRYRHYYKTGGIISILSPIPDFSAWNMQCEKVKPIYEIIIPKEKPKQDFYKIGNFHKKCDDACKYHCTRGNTQLAECLKKQTAIEWLVEEIEKLQLKSDLETNVSFIRIVEKAKEIEKEQITNAHLNGQAIFDKEKFREEVVKNAEQYYNETFEK